MFGKQELRSLQLRKQALLLQSGLNRLTIQFELERLREVGTLLGMVKGGPGRFKRWALVCAPIAGLATALGFRRSRKLVGSIAMLLPVIKPLIRFWRASAAPSK